MTNKKGNIIVVASGYFDPLHIGHINYLREAKKLGTKLIVIVNTDEQAKLKKNFSFMNEKERVEVVSSLKFVDRAILAVDKDKSVCKTLETLNPDVFAKGGDRTLDNIPERKICEEFGIKMVFGVGGKKAQSSSWLVKDVVIKKLGKKNLGKIKRSQI